MFYYQTKENKYNLFCGDFKNELNGVNADLICTSCPYNIGSKAPKKITNRKFGGFDSKSWGAIENYVDNLPEEEYQCQQRQFLIWCANHLSPNGTLVYNHKLRHKNGRIITPYSWFPNEEYLILRQEIVWDRGSTHNHTPSYVYDHSERLYVFSKPKAKPYFKNQDFYWNNKNKGVGDVWYIPREANNPHNAPFPVKLARHIIRLFCAPKGLVCDPYSGSGTTMLASYEEGRSFIGSEILSNYYNLAVNRFKKGVYGSNIY